MKMFGISLLAALTATAAQAAPIELSTPERAAAFQAAGFRHWAEGWTRCREDTSAAHIYGSLKVADLNGDGAPEAWIREISSVCYGDTAGTVVLLTRKPSGWTVLLDEIGMAMPLKATSNGWPDIEVSGARPTFRFDGTKYVRTSFPPKK